MRFLLLFALSTTVALPAIAADAVESVQIIVPGTSRDEAKRIYQQLRKPHDWICQDQRLGVLAALVSKRMNTPVHFHQSTVHSHLPKLRIADFRWQSVSPATVLEFVLTRLDLAWRVTNNRIEISDTGEFEETHPVFLVPVPDIAREERFGTLDTDTVEDTISGNVRPEAWDDRTGPGPIDSFGDTIIITEQSFAGGMDCLDLLATWQKLDRQDAQALTLFDPHDLHQRLARPIDFRIEDATAMDAVAKLTRAQNINLSISAEIEHIVESSTKSSWHFEGRPIWQIIDALTSNQLGWRIWNNVLEIRLNYAKSDPGIVRFYSTATVGDATTLSHTLRHASVSTREPIQYAWPIRDKAMLLNANYAQHAFVAEMLAGLRASQQAAARSSPQPIRVPIYYELKEGTAGRKATRILRKQFANDVVVRRLGRGVLIEATMTQHQQVRNELSVLRLSTEPVAPFGTP